MHRREFLTTLGAAGIALLSGCGGLAARSADPTSEGRAAASQAPAAPPATATAAATQAPAPTQTPAATAAPDPTEAAPIAIDLPAGPLAPPIDSATWLNTEPLKWDELRGKVTMVEFWTFGCINCRNVIPALRDMHAKYADKGLVIIGVHSPEFDYEKELDNVKKAVIDLKLDYPIAIDNEFDNWNRYRNRYWPTRYLVDKRGVMRYSHIGEGAYGETRVWIDQLLAE